MDGDGVEGLKCLVVEDDRWVGAPVFARICPTITPDPPLASRVVNKALERVQTDTLDHRAPPGQDGSNKQATLLCILKQ